MLSQTVHRWKGRPETSIGCRRFLRLGSVLPRETPSHASWLLLDASLARNHDKTVGMGYVVKMSEIILARQWGRKSLWTAPLAGGLVLAPGGAWQQGTQIESTSQAGRGNRRGMAGLVSGAVLRKWL